MNESCSHIGIPYPQSDLPHIFSFSGYTISDIECSIIMYTYDQLSPEDNHTRMKKNNLQQNLQQHAEPIKKHHPVTIFLLSLLIGTLLELAIGYFLDTVWGLRYWDYGGAFLNFHGYICFLSALGFGIAGTVWICFLSGFITRLWLKLPLPFRNTMNTILLLAFAVDCAAALIIPNVGKGITFSYNIGTLFLV